MKHFVVLMTVAGAAMVSPAQAQAASCFPVKADVVSLGEKAARAYGERSLNKHIAEQKLTIESTGVTVGKVRGKALHCKPFPNLLGADEWRCIGTARVCAKS